MEMRAALTPPPVFPPVAPPRDPLVAPARDDSDLEAFARLAISPTVDRQPIRRASGSFSAEAILKRTVDGKRSRIFREFWREGERRERG